MKPRARKARERGWWIIRNVPRKEAFASLQQAERALDSIRGVWPDAEIVYTREVIAPKKLKKRGRA